MEPHVVLASASPRRRELLARLIPAFEVCPSLFEERAEGLSAYETVRRFALGKARDVSSRLPQAAVIGADTVVSLGGRILGKPGSEEEAREMLRALSGREHSVYTGVCVCTSGREFVAVEETRVRFFPLGEALIGAYVKSGLPMDKAGAYGIQDGYPLVERCEGSYTNVVGLPLETLRALLCKARILKEEREC